MIFSNLQRMNKHPLLLTLLAVILASCKNEIKSSETFHPVYHINETISSKPEIKGISGLKGEIKYIAIKNNNNFIIPSLRKAVIDDNKVFVSEDQAIYVLDTLGNLETKIGKRGRGPEEYTQLNGGTFHVDKVKKEILIPDLIGRKVLVFDYSGKLKKIIHARYYIDDAVTISDSLYCLKIQPAPDTLKRIVSLIIVNEKGDIKKQFFSQSSPGMNFLSLCNLEKQGDNVIYKESYNDTIFRITPQLQKEIAGLCIVGKMKPPIEIFQNISSWESNITKYIFNYYLTYDSERVYFSIYFNLHVYCGEFKSTDGKPILWYNGPQNEGVKDDIDFGPPFSPFVKFDNGRMIDFLEPVELLKEKYNTVRKNSDLEKIRTTAKPEDNPIIRLVIFK
jgi:hypothetical protein